jgi:L-fuconolactonase
MPVHVSSSDMAPRVDAHCHLWSLSRGDYHWMDVNDPALKEIAKDFEIADLIEASQSSNIIEAVLVQAAATEEETDFLLTIAEKNSQIKGVVGWLDLSHHGVLDSINRYANNPYFKGIRPMLQDIEDTDWLREVPDKRIWQQMVKHGLRFDALIKPRHLDLIQEFCHENPDLPIVIDHCAKPQFATASSDELKHTFEKIAAIGKQTHAFCKLSGLLTEMATWQQADAYEILKPLFDLLIETFGSNRIMWGSDWPVVRLAGGYECWNEITMKLLEDLGQQDRHAILSHTARQFYGLDV